MQNLRNSANKGSDDAYDVSVSLTTSDGEQFKKVTFQVANVNKALGSGSKMVRSGSRVVFDTSGSYIENKMKRWSVRRGYDGGIEENRGVSRLMEGGACSRACKSS